MGVNSDLRMFHVFKVLHVHVQTLLEFVRPAKVSGNPRQVGVQRKLPLFRKFLFNKKSVIPVISQSVFYSLSPLVKHNYFLVISDLHALVVDDLGLLHDAEHALNDVVVIFVKLFCNFLSIQKRTQHFDELYNINGRVLLHFP